MYKLYGNNRGMKLLDISDDIEDIKFTLGTYIGCLDTIDYEIKKQIDNSEITIAKIKSYEDYINYKYDKTKILIKRK